MLLGLVGAVGACSDPLDVDNVDSPDRGIVFASPSDVVGIVGAQYEQIITGTIGATARIHTGLLTASFENSSTLANNGLGPRSAMPRPLLDNSRGNAYLNENFNDFRFMSQVARVAATAIAKSRETNFEPTLGAAQTARMRGFSWFVYGVAMGNLAMVYDSAGIPLPEDGPLDINPLVGYKELTEAALKALDSAFTHASSATATSAFPLPDAWLKSTGVSQTRFVQLIRSSRARVRANVARTPTERLAVDWAKVIDDATNGITADFTSNFDPNTGYDYTWLATGTHFRDTNWHQMTPYIIGMADSSRAYDAWLAVRRSDRVPFTIKTVDLRFPAGETRAAQNAVGQGAPTGRRYYRNRAPGLDQAATGWQNSEYDHYRWRSFADASRIGPFPVFTVAENDMLAAEGYLRTNQIAKAATLIDKTRTTAGLPSVAGITSLTQQVPGGNACVPRVPVGPTFTTTQCGTILEALKWEKRMETAYTVYGAWYFDSRGWGDLPEGTPTSWPVPYQELDARLLPIYTLGGVGGREAAGVSTYGFGTGDR
jgi:hypothetical protein